MPWDLSRAALASDAATAPSILFLIFARESMNRLTVEPEPTPTIASSTTYLSASSATAFLSSSWVIASFHLFLRRHVGAHALEELRRHAHRLAERGMRVNGLADVGRVGAHLDRER